MTDRRFWNRFWRADEGILAAEFAISVPIIFLLVAGIIDFMMVLFVTTLMEGGLQNASRLGRTGTDASDPPLRTQKILEEIEESTIGLVDMANITFTTSVYPCFDSIHQPEPFNDLPPGAGNGTYDPGETYSDINGNGEWDSDMAIAGLGNPGDVVLYELFYDWAALTPLIGTFFGPNGKIPITVSVAVRNEPFGFVAPTTPGPAGPGTTGC